MAWQVYIDLNCPDCKDPLDKNNPECSCKTLHHAYWYNDYCIPVLLDIDEPRIKSHRKFSNEMAGVLVSGLYFDAAPRNAYKYMEEKLIVGNLNLIKQDLKGDSPHPLLDIGCGDGRHIKLASDLGFKITGIEISERMIYSSIDVANSFDLDKGKFNPILADGAKLPFADNSYSVVLGLFGWPSFSPSYHQAIREMYRVLSPGGHVLITTYNYNSMANAVGDVFTNHTPFFTTRFPEDKWLLKGTHKDGSPMEHEVFCHAFTPKELLDLFELAGFEIINQNSICKISYMLSKESMKHVDPKIWIQLEELVDKEPGLRNSGSYIFLDARKPE